jgi:HK97 family phage major capsid protein
MHTLALEQKRGGLLRTAAAIVDKALREGRALRVGEEADCDGLEARADAITRTLNRANRLDQTDDALLTLARMVKSLGDGRSSVDSATRFATANYSHDPGLLRALSATIATSGGYSVPEGYSGEVIEALRPMVAVRSLNPVIVPMPHGNFVWPRISVGGTVQYQGENAVIPATDQSFQEVRLVAKKATSLTVVSGTLMRTASPAADQFIKADLTASLATLEDFNLLYGNGTQYTPRGLRSWVLPANVFTASTTVDVTHIDSDLSSLELALINANVRMRRPGWIMSIRTANFLSTLRNANSGILMYPEMNRFGLLRGKPFAATTNISTTQGTGSQTEIFLADFAEVLIGDAGLVVDVGKAATYVDGNGAVVAAFTKDEVVVRVILPTDLAMRHDAALAVLTGVNY